MAWSYDTLIAELTDRYNQADSHRSILNSEITQAIMDWQIPDDHACLQDVIQALEATRDCVIDLMAKGYHSWDGATKTLPDALDRAKACPFITIDDIPPIDMSAIINAMLTATPPEIEYFIGLADAFRQSIWNRPYNHEFFAALARGFEQWP